LIGPVVMTVEAIDPPCVRRPVQSGREIRKGLQVERVVRGRLALVDDAMGYDGSPPGDGGRSRRAFIRTGAAAAAAVASSDLLGGTAHAQPRAPAPGRVLGANDRIVVAYVGTGVQGTNHIRLSKQNAAAVNITQAAVCGLYQVRLDRARALLGLPEGASGSTTPSSAGGPGRGGRRDGAGPAGVCYDRPKRC
jgi:hypothetical protein